jgi:hypothetical protein
VKNPNFALIITVIPKDDSNSWWTGHSMPLVGLAKPAIDTARPARAALLSFLRIPSGTNIGNSQGLAEVT